MPNPIITYYDNGNIYSERWYVDDNLHRLDGPAFIRYHDNGKIHVEHWHADGKLNRLDGPAHITYYENGKIDSEYWYIKGNKIYPDYKSYPLTKEQQMEMKLTYA